MGDQKSAQNKKEHYSYTASTLDIIEQREIARRRSMKQEYFEKGKKSECVYSVKILSGSGSMHK
jgi:hypothetical protein